MKESTHGLANNSRFLHLNINCCPLSLFILYSPVVCCSLLLYFSLQLLPLLQQIFTILMTEFQLFSGTKKTQNKMDQRIQDLFQADELECLQR